MKKFSYHSPKILCAETQAEIERRRSVLCLVESTVEDMRRKAAALGYKFDSKFEYYFNNYNSNHYAGIVCPGAEEIDTGISFAHYKDARRDEKFAEFQELRRTHWAIHNNSIFMI